MAVKDDAAAGVMVLRVEPLDGSGRPLVETHRYDPLTGRLLARGG